MNQNVEKQYVPKILKNVFRSVKRGPLQIHWTNNKIKVFIRARWVKIY